ncbi:MAG: hypothetical protein H7831_17940 [Magnetococcus sp. WYHC-3]
MIPDIKDEKIVNMANEAGDPRAYLSGYMEGHEDGFREGVMCAGDRPSYAFMVSVAIGYMLAGAGIAMVVSGVLKWL